jgi:hypothetical protein
MPDPTSGIVTGEKIQLLCDHFIGDKNDSSLNPLLWRKNYKWLYFDELNAPINNRERIYCHTHVLHKMDLLIEKLQWLKNPFLLVFHNSDVSFTEKHVKLFDALPNLKKIFSKNCIINHNQVTPLPIGIANTQFAHGQLTVMDRVRNQKVKKDNLVYFNFSLKTNKEKREDCFLKVSKKGIEFQPNKKFDDYIESLSTYKFAICPEGSGLDTYRFWECLYLQVIPVCKRNVLAEHFSKDFPVVLLDDWNDLDLEQLDRSYSEFDWNCQNKLDMKYYAELILNQPLAV